MYNLSDKIKSDLDKLINIAQKYRDNTVSLSLFNDVISSIKEKNSDIDIYKEYLLEKNVKVVGDMEDIDNEDESADDSEKISPYDPSKIDITFKTISLDLIIKRLQNEEIDIAPDFQRKAGLWSAQQQSQLIESLILRIPLPAFYFDTEINDKWIVIDGLQRLTAIKKFFVDKTLKLSGLEFMIDLNGMNFDDMLRVYIRRMEETQMLAYIINPGAPINLKYNIFKRINTGGLSLEPQEIRHALYQGEATKYIQELAETDIFKKATGYSVPKERMLDREFVLRFIAFYEIGEDKYKDPIAEFLNNAMDYINKNYKNGEKKKEIKILFEKVLEVNIKLFDKFAFRRMPDMEKRRPISKALFEAWTSVIAKMTDEKIEQLIKKKTLLQNKYTKMFDENEFLDSIKSGKVSSVKRRFEKIKSLIEEVLKND